MAAKPAAPTDAELRSVMGKAFPAWEGIVAAIEKAFPPLTRQWKPSKLPFGRMCLLQQKKRTLLYLTPDQGQVWVAVVLGERAVEAALKSDLPKEIKKLIEEARAYAEGRGIRFAVRAKDDVAVVAELVKIKTTPR